MKRRSLPQNIGRGLAYFQDAIDRMVTFGFEQLQQFGEKKPQPKDPAMKNFFQKTAAFVGEMGTEYYRKYSEIKSERDAVKTKSGSTPRRKRS